MGSYIIEKVNRGSENNNAANSPRKFCPLLLKNVFVAFKI